MTRPFQARRAIDPALRAGLVLAAALVGLTVAGIHPWRAIVELARLTWSGVLPPTPSMVSAVVGVMAGPVVAVVLIAVVVGYAAHRRLDPLDAVAHKPGMVLPAVAGGITLGIPLIWLADLLVAVRARPGAALDGLVVWIVGTCWLAAAVLLLVGAIRANAAVGQRPTTRTGARQRPLA